MTFGPKARSLSRVQNLEPAYVPPPRLEAAPHILSNVDPESGVLCRSGPAYVSHPKHEDDVCPRKLSLRFPYPHNRVYRNSGAGAGVALASRAPHKQMLQLHSVIAVLLIKVKRFAANPIQN